MTDKKPEELLPVNMAREHCNRCKKETRPCKTCRREIHEAWHAMGYFWVNAEECSPLCHGWPNDEMKLWLRQRETQPAANRGPP